MNGPIPARAGEPLGGAAAARDLRPIPARAGEPLNARTGDDGPRGLSPPARGSRIGPRRRDLDRAFTSSGGPIPARAGEPVSAARCPLAAYPRPRGGALIAHPTATSYGAYPRPRGGALDQWSGTAHLVDGLSPPARGSRRSRSLAGPPRGPIPARAGEPRPRGGARAGEPLLPWPRDGGPIPARAGEPWTPSRVASRAPGLSPPARGSPLRPCEARPPRRPIPARAGEPQTPVLGGLSRGLSPPARGSLEDPGDRLERGPPSWRTGAYPRPRGGAL